MPRPKLYNSRAEKQAAYRRRKDVSHDLRRLLAALNKIAATGANCSVDPRLLLRDTPEGALRSLCDYLDRWNERRSLLALMEESPNG
jgi:hypothetical protein